MPVDQELRCAYCNQAIEPLQSYVHATCNKCDESNYHVWCVEEYVTRRLRTHHTNSKAIEKSKLQAKSKPWKELESLSRCPAGLYKITATAAATAPRQWQEGSVRNLCPGRVTSAELIDTPREVEKKKKRAPAAAQHAQHGRALHGAAARAAGAGAGGAGVHRVVGAGVTMSLAAAEEFLGIKHEEVQEEEEEEAGGSTIGALPPHHAAPDFMAPPPPHTPSGALSSSATRDAFHSEGAQEEAWADGDAGGSESELYLTPEEGEVAVQQGLLPPDFRTRLCGSLASPGGAATCPLGPRCSHAHSQEELRIEAGIQLGRLPGDYKLMFCKEQVSRGICSVGPRCPHAHSLEELRALAAIQAGYLPQGYKTQLCGPYMAAGVCPAGLLCGYAHGGQELRREAAVAAGLLPHRYKFGLCDAYAQGSCLLGEACHFAHGVGDLRLAAMIRDRFVSPVYKTALCGQFELTGHCATSRHCSFAHGAEELLPHLVTKAKLCPILKETGRCTPACPFAHRPLELQVVGVAEKVARLQEAPPLGEGGGARLSEAALTSQAEAAASTGLGASARDRDWGFTAGTAGTECSAGSQQGQQAQQQHGEGEGSLGPGSLGRESSAGGGGGMGPASSGQPSSAYQMYLKAKAAKEARTGGHHECSHQHYHQQQQGHQGLLKFRGHSRPPELKHCKVYRECGQCYIVNCPYAHGEAELAQREHRWVLAQQEQQAAQRREQAEQRKQQREEEASLRLLQRQQGGAHRGEGMEEDLVLALSDPVVELMRKHKRRACVTKLLDLGFDLSTAHMAANASGAEVEQAAGRLFDGEECFGNKPVNIDKEVEDLVRFGRHLGYSDESLEMELVLQEGDWEAVKEQLLYRQQDNRLPSEEDLYSPMSTAPGGVNAVPMPIPLPIPLPLGPPSAAGPAATSSSSSAAAVATQPSTSHLAPPPAPPKPNPPVQTAAPAAAAADAGAVGGWQAEGTVDEWEAGESGDPVTGWGAPPSERLETTVAGGAVSQAVDTAGDAVTWWGTPQPEPPTNTPAPTEVTGAACTAGGAVGTGAGRPPGRGSAEWATAVAAAEEDAWGWGAAGLPTGALAGTPRPLLAVPEEEQGMTAMAVQKTPAPTAGSAAGSAGTADVGSDGGAGAAGSQASGSGEGAASGAGPAWSLSDAAAEEAEAQAGGAVMEAREGVENAAAPSGLSAPEGGVGHPGTGDAAVAAAAPAAAAALAPGEEAGAEAAAAAAAVPSMEEVRAVGAADEGTAAGAAATVAPPVEEAAAAAAAAPAAAEEQEGRWESMLGAVQSAWAGEEAEGAPAETEAAGAAATAAGEAAAAEAAQPDSASAERAPAGAAPAGPEVALAVEESEAAPAPDPLAVPAEMTVGAEPREQTPAEGPEGVAEGAGAVLEMGEAPSPTVATPGAAVAAAEHSAERAEHAQQAAGDAAPAGEPTPAISSKAVLVEQQGQGQGLERPAWVAIGAQEAAEEQEQGQEQPQEQAQEAVGALEGGEGAACEACEGIPPWDLGEILPAGEPSPAAAAAAAAAAAGAAPAGGIPPGNLEEVLPAGEQQELGQPSPAAVQGVEPPAGRPPSSGVEGPATAGTAGAAWPSASSRQHAGAAVSPQESPPEDPPVGAAAVVRASEEHWEEGESAEVAPGTDPSIAQQAQQAGQPQAPAEQQEHAEQEGVEGSSASAEPPAASEAPQQQQQLQQGSSWAGAAAAAAAAQPQPPVPSEPQPPTVSHSASQGATAVSSSSGVDSGGTEAAGHAGMEGEPTIAGSTAGIAFGVGIDAAAGSAEEEDLEFEDMLALLGVGH